MKIEYFPDTDSLYIELKEGSESIESKEVAQGFVLDFDDNGNVIGIDIDTLASQKVDLGSVNLIRFDHKTNKEEAA